MCGGEFLTCCIKVKTTHSWADSFATSASLSETNNFEADNVASFPVKSDSGINNFLAYLQQYFTYNSRKNLHPHRTQRNEGVSVETGTL